MMTIHRTPSLTPSPNEFVALILDKDLVSSLSVRAVLESEGGCVIEVENGTDIIAAFRKRQPDIILLDAQMPEIDSFDLCIQIQGLPNGSNTPILILAALEDEALVNLALTVGAADYVTKPVHPVILRQRVRRLLQVHRIDEAIVRAKKEWEAACDAVSDIIILTDLNGKVIRCNFATTQRLQMTYSQLIGCDLGAVLLKDTSQKLSLPFGQPLEIQFPALPGWFEVRTFPGQLDGRPHAIVYIFKDISERKQLEENVRQGEQRFQALVENISEGVELFDLEGRVHYASPMVAQILGFSENTDFVGINPMNSLHPDDQERNLALFTQILQHPGGSFTTEVRVRHQDGSWIWVESTARNMLNEPGINAILVNFKDISKRKCADEALRASEARYRTLFEDSPVALWEEDYSAVKTFFDRLRTEEGITDFRAYFEAHPEAVIECAAGARVKDVNKAAMKLLNAQRKEQLLGDLNEIVSPETNRAFLEQLVAIAGGSMHYAFEGPNRALNGEIRLISGFWSVWPGYEDTLSNVTVSVVDLTERKQAETALSESEQRFRQLFDASPDAVIVIDPSHPVDWTIVDCNEAACQMNGYPREEMIGQSIDLLNATAGDALERSAYLEHLRREGVLHTEASHRHKDGHIFPVEISTTLLRLKGRELILGIDRDITERKQTEEALRLSEERFQLVTHATNDAVWDLNLPAGERWWNAGVQSLFGYTPNQVGADQAWWEARIHPDDRSRVLASFQTALTSDGQFWSKEYRFRRANGTYAYLFDRGYIIQDEHGRPQRVIGAIMDLSERKRMEGALIKSEELFSKAFHASPAPMAITRVDDGVFIDVNRSWERLLIYSREAVIGHPILEFDIYANAHERTAMIEQVRKHGRLDDFELKVKTSAGEERRLVVSAQTVEIQGQDCLLSTFYDITELQRLHEAMLASQKLADLGTLAAGVAHEMNSPLQVITGVSQSLLKKAGNGGVELEQLKSGLDVIRRNGWRCAEIVRSLHTYARASTGSKQPTDLNRLVHDCLLLIEHQLRSWASITIVTKLASDLPPLTCDHNQITQVLINLLTNARDAMPQGGDITIATAYDSRTDELLLRVKDSGTGIPSAIQAKIFDPFFTTKALGEGSGLGLSISVGIVRAHGGTMEVESTPGPGTTFIMRFPVQPFQLPISDTADVYGRFDDAAGITTTPISNNQENSHV